MKPVIVLLTCLMLSDITYAEDKIPNKEEHATIHVYRNGATAGMGWKMRMFVNGKKIKVKNASHYEIKVKPGETVLKMKEMGHQKITLNIEPGKDYYVKTFIRQGIFFSIPELVEVTPEFAANQLNHKIKEKNKKQIIL